MYKVLASGETNIHHNHPEFEAALQAECDFSVLGFVFTQARAHSTDPEFKRLVKNALKDSLLPNEDSEQSRGRDAQFELFVAAICQAAGLARVAREEPDVTCHIDGIKFGIAAKRIKSIARLENRVRNGAKQIRESGLPGIIALETNVALNPDNRRIVAPISEKDFGRLYGQELDKIIASFHGRLLEWVFDKGVCGIVIHDQQVRCGPDGEWMCVGMTKRVSVAQECPRLKREFELFDRYYWTGLPNVRRQ